MKNTSFVFLAFLFPVFFSSRASAQEMTTFAGSTGSTYSGDGGPATLALFNMPMGAATDASGNVYVADQGNNCIRKISTTDVITTVAGIGTGGYWGDGGPATSAMIQGPTGVVLDAAGNMYIADNGNERIRKINTSGIISTIAGNGDGGYSPDGIPATAAALSYPCSIAIDAGGNVIFTDQGTHRVRIINTAGIISTIAGDIAPGYSGDGAAATLASLNQPSGVAIDGSGNIYIADKMNNCIRKVSSSGIITTVAGTGAPGYTGDGGAATTATLYQPSGLCVDATGNIYVADMINYRVRRINTSGIINTVSGNGVSGYSGDGAAATSAEFNIPVAVSVDLPGNIYIVDLNNNRVRKVNTSGTISTFAGTGLVAFGDGGPAAAALFQDPNDLAIDGAGNVYIADRWGQKVRKVTPSGIISTFAGNGVAGYNGDGIAATTALLNQPAAVAVDASGNVYIADVINERIRVVNTAGVISTIAGVGYSNIPGFGDGGPATAAQLFSPQSIAIDGSGNIYISDINTAVRKISAAGIITKFAGAYGTGGYTGDGGPATTALLSNITAGLSADNAGNVFIADGNNNVIRKVNAGGIISTVAGNGTAGYSGDGGLATAAECTMPFGVTVDATGNLYVSDAINQRIRFINSGGIISTIAGDGAPGYSGDGGPATNASLSFPVSCHLDSHGSLYIVDENNKAIRKVLSASAMGVNNATEINAGTKVWPNPTNGLLHVTATGKITNISIFNLLGQQVYSHTYNSQLAEAEIYSLPEGMYFIRVNDFYVQKIIKE